MNKDKRYFQENSDGEFFFGSNYIHEVYDKIINDGLETYLSYSNVMSDNRLFLQNNIGKQTFCASDSCNRRLYVWERKLPSGSYWILTARERGTSYEVDKSVDLNEVMSDILSIFNLSYLKNDVLKDVHLVRL